MTSPPAESHEKPGLQELYSGAHECDMPLHFTRHSPGQVVSVHAAHSIHAIAELEKLVLRMRGGLVCDVSAERGQLFGEVGGLRGGGQWQQTGIPEATHGRALFHCKHTDKHRVRTWNSHCAMPWKLYNTMHNAHCIPLHVG